MKQNVNETESNWRFRKNVKTCKNIASVFTTVHWLSNCYYQLPITYCCKELHLKYGRVRRSVFENAAMHEN